MRFVAPAKSPQRIAPDHAYCAWSSLVLWLPTLAHATRTSRQSATKAGLSSAKGVNAWNRRFMQAIPWSVARILARRGQLRRDKPRAAAPTESAAARGYRPAGCWLHSHHSLRYRHIPRGEVGGDSAIRQQRAGDQADTRAPTTSQRRNEFVRIGIGRRLGADIQVGKQRREVTDLAVGDVDVGVQARTLDQQRHHAP